jgi:peptidoglycan/LPS O-acetylase OafA/YrhL
MTERAGGFDGIQGLRALAAIAVASLHIADEAGSLGGTPGQAPWSWLEAGVDLFFVISGFVLVWASWDRFGSVRSVLPFAWRRLVRVAPLYWLLTAVTVAAAVLLPGAISDGLRDGWGYVAASALFWPWPRQDGFVQPILRLGWTLEYEMLFYALLAAALPLPRRWGLAALLAAIAALAIAGQTIAFAAVPLAFWTDPIVLEFALGVLVAIATRAGYRAGLAGLMALAALCAVAVAAARLPGSDARVLVRGLPAALLVFCALSWTRVPRWAVVLGDASYALYLVHPFPMRALRLLFARLPGFDVPIVYALVTLLLCIFAAILLHRTIEQPILRWGRRAFTETATKRG